MIDCRTLFSCNREGERLRVQLRSPREIHHFGDPRIRDEMIETIMSELEEQTQHVVLSLDQINRVNSAVLGFFVQLDKTLGPRKISLGISGANVSIRKVMELTRLTRFLID